MHAPLSVRLRHSSTPPAARHPLPLTLLCCSVCACARAYLEQFEVRQVDLIRVGRGRLAACTQKRNKRNTRTATPDSVSTHASQRTNRRTHALHMSLPRTHSLRPLCLHRCRAACRTETSHGGGGAGWLVAVVSSLDWLVCDWGVASGAVARPLMQAGTAANGWLGSARSVGRSAAAGWGRRKNRRSRNQQNPRKRTRHRNFPHRHHAITRQRRQQIMHTHKNKTN